MLLPPDHFWRQALDYSRRWPRYELVYSPNADPPGKGSLAMLKGPPRLVAGSLLTNTGSSVIDLHLDGYVFPRPRIASEARFAHGGDDSGL